MDKFINILLPIDVLYDTRLGTLYQMDPQLADRVVVDNYHKRKSDFFKGVDKSVFDKAYENRNQKTLYDSYITNVCHFLSQIVSTLYVENTTNTPYSIKVNITLNTYPYNITDQSAQMICKMLALKVGLGVNVDWVYISQKELTPSFIKSRYQILFMYHYDTWLEEHTDEFEKVSINSVILYVPAISFVKDITDEDLIRFARTKTNPIHELKVLCAPFVRLEPIDVKIFSLVGGM